jgi:uncharacterized membrane protein
MEKRIAAISYWLGLLSLVLALITRLLNIFGVSLYQFSTEGNPVGFRSFLNAAILLFLTTIATACYTWFQTRQP